MTLTSPTLPRAQASITKGTRRLAVALALATVAVPLHLFGRWDAVTY
jgi:hypothetical protein